MIVPLLIFIAVGLTSYAGFLKLAARLLRYSVPVEGQSSFRGHYHGGCHFSSCGAL